MRHRRRHSRFGALVLIVVGVLFLLINLGIAPAAQIRALLAQWWPLVLIVVGVWLLAQPRRGGEDETPGT